MWVSDHVCGNVPVLREKMSEQCDVGGVFMISIRERHDAVCKVVAEGLEHGQSLLECGVTNNTPVAVLQVVTGGGKVSCTVSASG